MITQVRQTTKLVQLLHLILDTSSRMTSLRDTDTNRAHPLQRLTVIHCTVAVH